MCKTDLRKLLGVYNAAGAQRNAAKGESTADEGATLGKWHGGTAGKYGRRNADKVVWKTRELPKIRNSDLPVQAYDRLGRCSCLLLSGTIAPPIVGLSCWREARAKLALRLGNPGWIAGSGCPNGGQKSEMNPETHAALAAMNGTL